MLCHGIFQIQYWDEFRPHSQCKNDQYFPKNGKNSQSEISVPVGTKQLKYLL